MSKTLFRLERGFEPLSSRFQPLTEAYKMLPSTHPQSPIVNENIEDYSFLAEDNQEVQNGQKNLVAQA